MYNSEHFLGYVIFFHLPSVNLQVFGSQNCTLTLGEINTSWTPPETDRPRRKKLWRFKDLVTSNCKQYYNRCFIQKCPENFLCLFFFFLLSATKLFLVTYCKTRSSSSVSVILFWTELYVQEQSEQI